MPVSRLRVRVVDAATDQVLPQYAERVAVHTRWDLDTVEEIKGWTIGRRVRRKVVEDALVVEIDHDQRLLCVSTITHMPGRKLAENDCAVVAPGDEAELTVRLAHVESGRVPEYRWRQAGRMADALLENVPRLQTYGAVRGRLVRQKAWQNEWRFGEWESVDGVSAHVCGVDSGGSEYLTVEAGFGPYDTSSDWVLVPLRPGRKRIVVADRVSCTWETEVEVRVGETIDLGTVLLDPASGEFRVIAEDDAGNPLPFAHASFSGKHPAPRNPLSDFGMWLGTGEPLSGENGEVVARPVPPESQRLKIELKCLGYETVEIVANVQESPLHVRMKRVDISGRVSGVVLDEAARPIEGAMVFLIQAKYGVGTDAAGRFGLSGIPVAWGTVELKFDCTGFKARTLTVPLGTKDVRITLSREQ